MGPQFNVSSARGRERGSERESREGRWGQEQGDMEGERESKQERDIERAKRVTTCSYYVVQRKIFLGCVILKATVHLCFVHLLDSFH